MNRLPPMTDNEIATFKLVRSQENILKLSAQLARKAQNTVKRKKELESKENEDPQLRKSKITPSTIIIPSLSTPLSSSNDLYQEINDAANNLTNNAASWIPPEQNNNKPSKSITRLNTNKSR